MNKYLTKKNFIEVYCANGKFKISKEDKNILKDKWYIGQNGYVYNTMTDELLHRVLLGLKKGDKAMVDHKNRDTLDNRRNNLRIASDSENGYNKRRQSNNTTGYTGVSFAKWCNLYRVQLWHNKKKINGGYYKTKKEAAEKYNKLAKKYHGEFALINKIKC